MIIKRSLIIPSLFALGRRCRERLSVANGELVNHQSRHTARSFHFERITLVLCKNNFITRSSPEYYKRYRQHKAGQEKHREERQQNTKKTDTNKKY